MIEERASGSQYGGILRGRDAAKITGADVAGSLAEHLRFVPQSVALDERGVDGEVATGGVLDEEGDIWGLIEKFFQ